jgi:diacylglycerol kinase family enzyme
MKINIIINPASGTYLIHQMSKHIVKILEKHFSTQALYTQHPRHAIELAKECIKQGCDVIVIVGGDGTVNEVASAIINSNTSLLIIPTGSGNGLARDLKMYG